ncbi:MAG: flagellar basal body rod protein FlgB [Thermodesulfobacteriota bacterium]
MSDSRLFGYTSRLIGQALNVSAKRHNLITSNVANMDTIGYKPKDLDFDKTLKRAMGEKEPDYLDKTHPDHLSPNDEKPFNMSGKNSEDVDIYHLDSVNIDREMMNLTENNIKYQTIVELKSRKSAIKSYAIEEGGK